MRKQQICTFDTSQANRVGTVHSAVVSRPYTHDVFVRHVNKDVGMSVHYFGCGHPSDQTKEGERESARHSTSGVESARADAADKSARRMANVIIGRLEIKLA